MAFTKFNNWVMNCRFKLGYSLADMAQKLNVLTQDLKAFEMGEEDYLYDFDGNKIPSIEVIERIRKLFDMKGLVLFNPKALNGISFSINAKDLDEFKDQWRDLVKYTRYILGLSQPEFAEIIGVSLPSIRNWESNKYKHAPKTSSVFKLASLYGPVQMILNGGEQDV